MESNIEVCNCTEIHKDCVNCVKENMLSNKVFTDLSELFKVFGDYTRIKIIYALFKKELCVCDIAELLGMSQSSISHQLRVLKAARLVKFRKEGKVVYYSLDDEHIGSIFNAGLEHLGHE
ncbi:metalloregulator ArsR/SmtB family transcription factor [Clostridium swellfunianum]|uniref:ArsR/SmtB family transcription factor n=1 Tax=Clostridium swellfunianum TaxID=1367462 RepID=UPI00202E065B|nr:metalloregulator ArsR/SmtB family transcription factor [Clostridium swellfunianum]MCM0649528.1 metalloregulator ArsR/SmtB family transcription factor [Clostridium swellfunianum]